MEVEETADKEEASAVEGAGPQETETAGADVTETDPHIIPKWRLSVLALDQNITFQPVLGVYYRIGKRTDFGLSVDGNIDFFDRDYSTQNGGSGTSYGTAWEDDTYDFAGVAEMRRWSRISDRVTWYWGGRMNLGYTHDENKRYDEDRLDQTTLQERMVGTGFVIGAELKLLDHLYGSVSFAPILLKYRWFEEERLAVIPPQDEQEEKRYTSTRTYDSFNFDAKPYAAAYVSLGF